ncbi:hypothetical protein CDG81_12720 [Actinopolyspora erythraea]|uniref:AMP-dependent synthetase n=1 Tax=Actinopolyspora erythraea TaxID=414996 RepID=A0A223RT01_9ACTN|nr:AMP-binding protein [Actinopolyspora erythraea]ASU79008.1 hypothetical protein CDG81_12720 [Actinopolyspora erythraea]
MWKIPLKPLELPEERSAALAVLRDGIGEALAGGIAVAPGADAGEVPETVSPGVAAVVTTSGSTGRPKRTVLGREALRASAAGTEAALGGPGSWLLTLPPGHVAGFQVVTRAVLSGSEVTPVDTSEGFTPEAFVAGSRALPPGRRYVSLVPTQLKRLLAEPAARAELGRFDGVLIGGAPLDAATAERARQVAQIRTTYGMTETCGGCVYDGTPLRDVRIRILDGEIHLGGPVLAEGYLGDDQRDAAFYTDSEGRWFRTADRGRIVDGRLRVDGRLDDMINTGGVKVPPRAVDDCIEGLPGVAESCTFGLPDPEWGEVVASYVCVVPGTGLAGERIRGLVRERLDHYFAPRSVVVTEDPPRLPNGKLDRRRIREAFPSREEHD